MKDIEEFVEWMTLNPELAEKYYPELTKGLKNRIQKKEPFVTALIIEKLPSHFVQWKNEAEQGLVTTRIRKINGYINLLNLVLFEFHYSNEIETMAIEKVRGELNEQLEYWNAELKAQSIQREEQKNESESIEIKPIFSPESVQPLFTIIKDFFSPEQQSDLKALIKTGSKNRKKLLFKGNGNQLTDTFKKLFEHYLITGCQKKDLIEWIIFNFTYISKGKAKTFVYDTVEKTISRNDNPCKSPLIEIKNGQVKKVEQPRVRKSSK